MRKFTRMVELRGDVLDEVDRRRGRISHSKYLDGLLKEYFRKLKLAEKYNEHN